MVYVEYCMYTSRFLFFWVTLLISKVTSAQVSEYDTRKAIKSLREQGIDSIVVYTTFHTFPQSQSDSVPCFAGPPAYVIWKKNGKVCIQKIELNFTKLCDDYSIHSSSMAEAGDSKIFKILEKHYEAIESIEMRPWVVKERVGRKFRYREIHWSCPSSYSLQINNEDTSFSFGVDMKYLEKKSSPRFKNLNYSFNISTKRAELIRQIEREIALLESRKLFVFE